MPQEVSSRESDWFSKYIVQPILSIIGIDAVNVNVVRKLAHITEFFVLSTLLTIIWRGKLLNSLMSGFTIAFLDESIQLFSGRGSLIKDVWIDLIGVALGLLCGSLILFLCSKHSKNKRQ